MSQSDNNEPTMEQLLEEAIDDSVQDVYHVYRPAIGDHKMDAHPWQWHRERHAAFAAWLHALAVRVETQIEREVTGK